LASDEEKSEDEEILAPPTRGSKSGNSKGDDEVTSKFSRLAYNEDSNVKKTGSMFDDQRPASTSSNQQPSRGAGGRYNEPSRQQRNNNDDGPDYARKNFSSAKSISSDQYFGTDKQDNNNFERQQKISQFQGARAISSAEYFDRDETVPISDMTASDLARKFAYSAKTDIGSLAAGAIDASKKLGDIASNFFNDIQDRYS